MSLSLAKIRKEIDVIDKALLDLLKKRVRLSWQVRQEKIATGEALDTPLRETQIIAQLISNADEWITKEDIMELWPELIRRSKKNAANIETPE
jgi:chorismate mutase